MLLSHPVLTSLLCSGPPPRLQPVRLQAGVPVSSEEACKLLEAGEATLLDIRQPGEYRLDGHVEGSVNIPSHEWMHGFHLARDDFAAECLEELSVTSRLLIVHSYEQLASAACSALTAAGFSDCAGMSKNI